MHFARLNPNGGLDESFAPAFIGNSIALQPDGKILVGTRRLNPDGSLDAEFQNATEVEAVPSILVQSDGKIVYGGESLIRLKPDGALDDAFNCEYDGWRVVAQPDGKLLTEGTVRRFCAADHPPIITGVVRTGGDVTVTWRSIPGRSYRVQSRETLSGDGWSDLGHELTADEDVSSLTHWASPDERARFYRVLEAR